MECDRIDDMLEGLADGSLEVGEEARAHVSTCATCGARLDLARAIDAALGARKVPSVPAGFTAAVMARVRREGWQREQVFDLGFNLAIAAGGLLVLAGAAGLAWSAGLVAIDLDLPALAAAAAGAWAPRVAAEARTVAMGALLLTAALSLWWWVETDRIA